MSLSFQVAGGSEQVQVFGQARQGRHGCIPIVFEQIGGLLKQFVFDLGSAELCVFFVDLLKMPFRADEKTE